MSVNIGDKAPDFTMPTDGGGSVTLSQLKGKPVVLYFYPKDDTSGCTAEACGFRDTFPDYGKTSAVVIGVFSSCDTTEMNVFCISCARRKLVMSRTLATILVSAPSSLSIGA